MSFFIAPSQLFSRFSCKFHKKLVTLPPIPRSGGSRGLWLRIRPRLFYGLQKAFSNVTICTIKRQKFDSIDRSNATERHASELYSNLTFTHSMWYIIVYIHIIHVYMYAG